MEQNSPQMFGSHPEFPKGFLSEIWPLRKTLSIKEFYNPEHPEIFLIPRSDFLEVLDDFYDPLGLEITNFPFSSFDFFIDFENNENGVFYSLAKNSAFWRLGGISQLGYLVPNKDEKDFDHQKIYYITPTFPHSRWIHSLITAILAEVVLARNNFPPEARAPFVLAAGSHDIATPAGGDSIMRMSKELSEERNYSWILKYYGLDKIWEKEFNFDLKAAQGWIFGKGFLGHLLNILDRISYTCLDCYYLGYQKNNAVRAFCNRHPLVMDIWQDIAFSEELETFYFKKPEKLYNFLYLRALEHSELLFDPRSRALDFYLEKYTRKLYEKGVITNINLLTNNDEWLRLTLEKNFPEEFKSLLSPDILSWKKFKTEKEMADFCSEMDPRKIDHTDHIKGFKLGIDWLVESKGEVVKLEDCFDKDRIQQLKAIVESTKGYYVYYQE